jgi:hypothetical protein
MEVTGDPAYLDLAKRWAKGTTIRKAVIQKRVCTGEITEGWALNPYFYD